MSSSIAGNNRASAGHIFAHDHVVAPFATIGKNADIGLLVNLPDKSVVNQRSKIYTLRRNAIFVKSSLQDGSTVFVGSAK